MSSGIYHALDLLSEPIKNMLFAIGSQKLEEITEIRLRCKRPLSICINNCTYFVSKYGLQALSNGAYICSDADVEYTFKTAFSYSFHSFSKELSMGYITTNGGNRVGVCGSAIVSSEDYMKIDSIKYVSSLNIRVSHEVMGFSDKLYNECFSSKISSVLIIGLPASGKTTLLRDITRKLGNKVKVSLVDEQNEISATYRNCPQNSVGKLTDIFVGYPKSKGVSISVRVMSPEVIVVDEIGSNADYDAIYLANACGISVVTAVHGNSIEQVKRKQGIRKMLEDKIFEYCVIMKKDYEYEVIKLD